MFLSSFFYLPYDYKFISPTRKKYKDWIGDTIVFVKEIFANFWKWYEEHKRLNYGVAAFLFAIQIVHLYWLTTHVVFLKAFGQSFFNPSETFETILLLVDYTEIPALVSVSLVYVNNLRKKYDLKSVLYLIFLNSQWLHIFWITDEFVVERFSGNVTETILPVWLAWVAILIDYLELPVIYDTMKEFVKELRTGDVEGAFEKLKEED